MRTKTVKRHYCDHCNKGMLQIPAMVKHEKGCTLNPDRICGMCGFNGGTPSPPIDELKAIHQEDIDNSIANGSNLETVGFEPLMTYPSLRGDLLKATDCPACILAVIRQSNEERVFLNFDYQKELKEFWAAHNDEPEYGGPH